MRSSIRERSVALARLCQTDPLDAAEEQRLFLRLKVARQGTAKGTRRGRRPDANRGDCQRASRAAALRNQIALSNLRLVVSVAKRFAGPRQSIEDLVSEASLLLLRCVEKFDVGRGTRFSTYATRALAHHFGRLRRQERRQFVGPMQTGFAGEREPQPVSADPAERLIQREDLQRLGARLATLPRRERDLLAARFGLDDHGEPQTFRELAAAHGLSKEWARIATAGALEQLRAALDEDSGDGDRR
jgi:RNA polymerase primary sigma factor